MGHVSQYPRSMESLAERVFPFSPYTPNHIYWNPEGFHVFKNTRGFIHVLKPCRILLDGALHHWEIQDLLLTKDGKLHETSCGGHYKSKEECILEIEKSMDEEEKDVRISAI